MRPGPRTAPLLLPPLRILLTPPLMALLLVDGIPGAAWWALGVFIFACATDSLDGWLARSRGMVTVAGAFLDPLADKLLISAALVCLVETGAVSAWAAMIIIAREFAVTGLRLVAAAENVIISAGRFGKAKAFSQNVALALIICPGISEVVRDTFLGIALVLTVLSGAHYFLVARWRIFSGKAMSHPDSISER